MSKVGAPSLIATLMCLTLSSVSPAQEPQRTTATYDEWTASCELIPPEGKRSCQLLQEHTLSGSARPISRTTIRLPSKAGTFTIAIEVPSNVWISDGVKLKADDDVSSLSAPFKWCNGQRCVAEADMSDAAIQKLRKATLPSNLRAPSSETLQSRYPSRDLARH